MGGVGTMDYGNTAKPYQVTMLTPTGDAVPEREQTVTYTSFQRPNSISENGITAAFLYNAAGDRVKMQVTQSNNALLTRYYIGGQYELDAETNTERLYLGGDAYSAPAVYVKEANVWKICYICRDYLGSITHIANADGSLKQELSYDAWGRFFVPDPYIQNPLSSQNYNRYTYAMNNPLVYIDRDGENPLVVIGIIVGFFYLKTAHDKAPKEDQGNPLKWIWNPLDWGTPDEVVLHFGSNTDGSGMHGGISAGKSGQPQPMVGYSSNHSWGMGYNQNGNNHVYYPRNDNNKPEKAALEAMNRARQLHQTVENVTQTFHQMWNSDIARVFIPDVVYINVSGVGVVGAGTGLDLGVALPLRGQDAGKYYLYSTFKGRGGVHAGASFNVGTSSYIGPVDEFDFERSFYGESYGAEFDWEVIGVSLSLSKDANENYLLSKDFGIGIGTGYSAGVGTTKGGAIPYIRHPFSFFW